MNSSKESEKRQTNPIIEANFLSKWFFCWTGEIFGKGMREKLTANDLYTHIPSLDSSRISQELIKYWEHERRRKQPNLLHMIFRAYGWKFVPICILYSMLEIVISSAQPLFLGNFVSYFSEGQTSISETQAYLYATGIVLCSLLSSLCFHPFMFFLFETGTRIRLACSGLVYRKCLRSSVQADNSGMGAFAISVLSTDMPQFDKSFYFFHELWKGPIEAIVFGYIMYTVVGWPAIIGIAAIALFIPLQAWAAQATSKYKDQSASRGDERVQLMHEIITAIQVIKMYAWEKSFAKLIAATRKQELKATRGYMNIYAALECTNMISNLALFLSLVAYVYTGDLVTAQKVFLISSYYSALKDSLLHYWPLGITTWAQTVVCARRVVTFLTLSEYPADEGRHNFSVAKEQKEEEEKEQRRYHGRLYNPNASEKSVILREVTASWHKVESQPPMTHVAGLSLHAHPKDFIGIVGNVGSGKSTLLNVLLGELAIVKGSLEVNGVLSYAAQEAWIFEASIRANITFVEPFDAQRYKAVLHACELERDIELFPYGDSTIVGERGISLSGGQKARVNLARAVYKRADIYLFDDPLSAVDAHVAKRLVQKCFKQFLGNSIRILVTHRVQHLQDTTQLIVMEGGAIELQGSYEDLKKSLRFYKHLEQNNVEPGSKMQHSESIKRNSMNIDLQQQEVLEDAGEARKEQLLQGSVRTHTYTSYFRALGVLWVIFVILALFVVARGSQAVMDIFISKWATWEESISLSLEPAAVYFPQRQRIVILYTILILCTLLLYILRTFGFFWICLKISLKLHDSLFNGIIRAYMYFFNNNPSGRILNRFSSDINNIDVALPQAMLDSIGFYIDAFAVLVIVAIANYWLLIPTVIVIALLYLCRALYIGASRSLKRIESMTRSPVYSHTNQTFHGLTTIRALNATQQLDQEFHGYQNHNTSALYLYVATNRAFAFWTDLICVLYILAVTYSFLLIKQNFYSGDVGLAITQSMTLVIMCQWGLRQTAEMENNMTSVERVLEYAETPSEPPLETAQDLQLPGDWPNAGHLRFSKLSLRYAEHEDYVLKNLNFAINPMEKVGIVGRTGAGKSSIIQAIFRLALNEGLIELDGYDIATLGLHDLRSRISIIPQDPVLFSGTLRYNLDPFAQKSDEEMWQALADVKLKAYVLTLEGGLSYRMHEGGSNFSMGQRQLICMARAILRRNKLLIMDEATANVDPDTDMLIQEAIHSKFAQCTVLTIAHRLHTVVDNDRVLVMDAGHVVELGHPHELLQNKQGFLYKLVENTGSGTARNLKLIAEESYRKRVTNSIAR